MFVRLIIFYVLLQCKRYNSTSSEKNGISLKGSPTKLPSIMPSRVPSSIPTFLPSCYPSMSPSAVPSSTPSTILSQYPTIIPSESVEDPMCDVAAAFQIPPKGWLCNNGVPLGNTCVWSGVNCTSGTTGAVNRIVVTNIYLGGTLSSFIGKITTLTTLALQNVSIHGSVPSEVSALSKLKVLFLPYNLLTGTIPEIYSQLSNLTVLNLNGNNLTSSIPSAMGSLSNLVQFDVRLNQLNGTLPSELGRLTKLTWLNVAANSLSSSIPSAVGNLTNLSYLAMDGNSLAGSIPTALGQLVKLRVFFGSRNKLTGPIPSQLGVLQGLTALQFDTNRLTGSIPSTLGTCTRLGQIYLEQNQLMGAIPTELGMLKALTYLDLDTNLLSGPIPTELGSLSRLSWLSLRNNRLTSPIPWPALSSLRSLSHLELAKNPLLSATSLPSTIAQLSLLTLLNLQLVNVKGAVPTEIGLLKQLVVLDLSVNQLNGTIPPALALSILTSLELMLNSFSGTIPSQIYSLNKLTRLVLSSNRLTGTVSSLVGGISSLQILALDSNRLNGTIPSEIGNLQQLFALLLHENFFTGSITQGVCSLPLFKLPSATFHLCTDCGDTRTSTRAGCPLITSVPKCVFETAFLKKCIGSLAGELDEVPAINVSLASTTATSITVNVLVQSTNYLYLTCYALPAGSPITSTLQIEASAPAVYTTSKTSPYTIVGLSPLENVDVYCFARSLYDVPMQLPDVMAARLAASTACCKGISFLAGPAIIYTNTSDGRSALVYSLSSAPGSQITVSHLVNDSNVAVLQASADFATSSSLLQRSFLLVGPPGVYSVSLVISGSSSSEFTAPVPQVVTILKHHTPLRSPRLVSGVISDNGGSAVISFDSASDFAGIQSLSWQCDALFAFSYASSCICSWLNSSSVLVGFPVYAGGMSLPQPGDSLAVNSGLLRAACAALTDCSLNIVSAAQVAVFLPPLHPVTPIVSLAAPNAIGAGDDLTVDATASIGAGGRPWEAVSWSLTSDGVFNSTLFQSNILDPAGDDTLLLQPLRIPGGLLPPALYTFSLLLQNYLGQSTSSSVSLRILALSSVPQIVILGPSIVSLNAYDTLLLQSDVTASSATALSYQWSVFSGSNRLNVSSLSIDPRVFKINAYALAASQTYSVRVNVSDGTSYASAEVQVLVGIGSVRAYIRGGDARTAIVSSSFVLDASASRDLLVVSSSVSSLSYAWECQISSGLSYGLSCIHLLPIGARQQAIVTIPPNSLSPQVSYKFSVTASSRDGRSDTASVLVQGVDGSGLQVSISTFSTRVNANDIMQMDGIIAATANVSLAWNVSSTSTRIDLADMVCTPLDRVYSLSAEAPLVSFPVGVDTRRLLPGATYTFTLSAATQSPSPVFSSATVSITVNIAPSLGYTTVEPSVGAALETVFMVASLGWVAEEGGYPLQYDFSYVSNASDTGLTIGSLSLRSSVLTFLPSGQLLISSRVLDVFGASASASASGVSVAAPIGGLASFAVSLENAVNASARDYNTDLILQSLNAISTELQINPPSSNSSVLDELISSMCLALATVAAGHDPSSALLDALVASMLEALKPGYAMSEATLTSCSAVFLNLAGLVSTDLSNSLLSPTAGRVADVISMLVQSLHEVSSANSSPMLQLLGTDLSNVLSSLIDGVLKGMMNGQHPVALSSAALALTVYNELHSDMSHRLMYAPDSSSSMQLPGAGMNSCGDNSTYKQLSVAQWATSPYVNSTALKTPLLRVSTSGAQDEVSQVMPDSNFTLTLSFTVAQTFNVTPGRIENASYVPDCVRHENNSFVPCDCTLVSFTSDNASFSCSMASGFCGKRTSSRRLQSLNSSTIRLTQISYDPNSYEYGALLKSVYSVIQGTLTTNILAARPSQRVTAAVVVVVAWVVILVAGIIYFRRWDVLELMIVRYRGEQLMDNSNCPISSKQTRASQITFKRLKNLRQALDSAFIHKERILEEQFNENSQEYQNRMKWHARISCLLFCCMPFSKKSRRRLSRYISGDLIPKLWNAVLRYHPFTWFFIGGSLEKPRVIRFITTLKTILVAAFISTVFFAVFYPGDSICTVHDGSNEATCLAVPSRIFSSESECAWDAVSAACSVRPPPETAEFIIIVALITTAFMIPLDWTFYLALNCICNRRPVLEIIGLDSLHWLGGYGDLNLSAAYSGEVAVNYLLRAFYAFEMRLEDGLCSAEESASMVYVLEQYGLRLKDAKVELNTFSSLFYASIGDCIARKIKRAHLDAVEIVFNAKRYIQGPQRDAYLIQRFYLEQVDTFSRIGLRREFAHYLHDTPKPIHPLIWLAGWAYVIGCALFFIYWILAFAVSNNGLAEANWGTNCILQMVQEIFILSIVRIVIINIFLVHRLRPFLRRMRGSMKSVLRRMSSSSNRDYPSKAAEFQSRAEFTRQSSTFASARSETSSMAGEGGKPPSLLRLMSPASIAATFRDLRDLLGARVLMHMNDNDVYSFRRRGTSELGDDDSADGDVVDILDFSSEAVLNGSFSQV